MEFRNVHWFGDFHFLTHQYLKNVFLCIENKWGFSLHEIHVVTYFDVQYTVICISESKRFVECAFNDEYMCGYATKLEENVADAKWTRTVEDTSGRPRSSLIINKF